MNASRDSAQVTGNPKLSARPWWFWEVNYWKLLAHAMRLRVRDTRRFVKARLQNLQSMFGGEPRLVRAAIAQHVQKITLTPAGKNYIASGVWDWLGSTRIACNSHKTRETSGDSLNVAVRMVPGASHARYCHKLCSLLT
jgi:hypothetical protein